MRRFITLSALTLTACTGGNHLDYLQMRSIDAPRVEAFTHCYNYGCSKREKVSLPPATKSKIDRIFKSPAKNPIDEQQKIIQALQIFEKDIGEITGTKNDKRGTFLLYQDDSAESKSFQQDCIDESTNTTIYLTLLNNIGYLKFYHPTFPATRQPFIGGGNWWHQTATIQNIETEEHYAVDTWFEDNGVPGYIVPLETWKSGWKPKRD